MAWIRVEAGIARRKVTYRLTEALMADDVRADLGADVSAYVIRAAAIGFLVSLWGAVAEHSANGAIADVPDLLLEEWAGWHGTPRAFARWVRAHHVDADGRLRDWDETNGPLDTRRENNRRAAQAHRNRQRAGRAGRAEPPEKPDQRPEPPDDQRPEPPPVSADVSGSQGINVRTNGRTDVRTELHPSPSGEGLAESPEGDPPRPRTMLMPRDKTAKGIAERLGTLVAEIHAGTRERLGAEQQRRAYAMIVFTYWASKCAATDRVLFDKQREDRIVRALREGGDDISELFYAIDGALRDPWHNGRRNGEKHLGVDHIFRNRERVEMLATLVHGYAQHTQHPEAARYVAAMTVEVSDVS